MNTDDLKALISDKQVIDFETCEQDFEHELRLTLHDMESGEVGVLAVTARELALPEEIALDYSYQAAASPFRAPYDECLIADLQTRTGPDYERGEVPFLFD